MSEQQQKQEQTLSNWLDDPGWRERPDDFTGWEGRGPAVYRMAETVCSEGFAQLPPRLSRRWKAADRLIERAADVLGELGAIDIIERGKDRLAILAGPPLTKWATESAKLNAGSFNRDESNRP